MKKLIVSTLMALTNLYTANATANDLMVDMQVLFEKRLEIRKKANNANKNLIKHTLEQLRDKEELLGEESHQYKNLPLEAKSGKAFSSSKYLLNPKYAQLDFKSGDVIVLRGTSALSALVSNLTDTPSSYSHTLIVYVNPKDNSQWGIEALIDKGIVAQPLESILTEGVPRVMLYRHQNEKLASKAAQAAYDYSQLPAEKRIGYDTKLNLGDYGAVYCSEFVRMVFDMASAGKVVLPSYPSTIGGKFAGLQKALDLQKTKFLVYAPLDIDLETSFDLVGEWRDFDTTVNYRIKDQIVTFVLEWLETQKSNVATANAVYKATKSNKEAKKEEKKVEDSSSSSDAIPKLLSGLDILLNLETKIFVSKNNEYLNKNGRNMTNEEIKAAIAKSTLKKHAEIIFIQNGFLTK